MRVIGFRPKQAIPESQKNEEWCKDNIDYYISLCPIHALNSRDRMCYNLFNGERNAAQFEYLTKTFGIEFPAKLKHIPLIRPLFNELIGEEWKRELNFIIRAEDSDSIDAKNNYIKNNLLDNIVKELVTSIEVKKHGGSIDLEEKLKGLEKYYKQDYQTDLEMSATKALKCLIVDQNLKSKFATQLLDQIITGKEFYRTEIVRIGQDPVHHVISPEELFYSGDDDVEWVKECEWAVHPQRMSPTEILDRWGERLKAEDVKKLEDYIDIFEKSAFKINDGRDLDSFNSMDGISSANKLIVYHVEWISIREINLLESENKYKPEYPFLKNISYEELQELPNSRKEKVTKRYIQERWEGIRIGDEIYTALGKSKYVSRSVGSPSKAYLSYNGKINSTRSNTPYSLVWATKDLQDLYDILHFHKENMIALSGSKGIVMDNSQLPEMGGGSPQEDIKLWLYYKKLGIAWIDRAKEGADKSFNQFQSYDDTLSSSIQYILQLISHIEDVAGRIIGVNRQRLGSVFQNDGKSTTESAIFQSSLVTEPMFRQHYEVVKEALKDLLNAARIAWKDGKTGSYITDNYLSEVFTLNSDFPLADLGVYLIDAGKEEQNINELKAAATQMLASQLIDAKTFVKLFSKSSLREIQKDLDYGLDMRDIQLQKQAENQSKLDQQTAQVSEQAKQQMQQIDLQFKQAELQIKQQELEQNERLKTRELELKDEDNRRKNELESQRIELEKEQLLFSANAKEVKN